MGCIFCMIANKEIKSSVVYENEHVIAILDLSQANEGHTLVMPKKHFDNILDLDSETYTHLMEAVRVVTLAINKAFNPEGINILNNCKKAAGQTVMHFHIHVIPRYDSSDNLTIEFTPAQIGKLNLPAIADEIKKDL